MGSLGERGGVASSAERFGAGWCEKSRGITFSLTQNGPSPMSVSVETSSTRENIADPFSWVR
jgi:hypothetical protein